MPGYKDVITLFQLDGLKPQNKGIDLALMDVAGDIAPLNAVTDGTPVIGKLDLHFRALRNAESRFMGFDPDRITSAAGKAAGEAMGAYRDAFTGMHEVYGLACGPGRTMEQAETLFAYLRNVAFNARVHLTAYEKAMESVRIPSQEEYEAANRERRMAPKRDIPKPQTPTTPRVRLPLDGEKAAIRARTTLGYAFGGLGAAYLMLKTRPGDFAGMIALLDLSGIKDYVSFQASILESRGAKEDMLISANVSGVSDVLDRLYDEVEGKVTGTVVKEIDNSRLAEMVLDTVRLARDALRRVESLARDSGYSLGIDEEDPSSLAP